MVFVRNPQFRITPISRDGMTLALSLEAPNSVIDTGKITDVDPALGAGIASRNRCPMLAVSFKLETPTGATCAPPASCAKWASRTPPAPTASPPSQKTGYGLNLSGTWKLFGKDQLNWQLVGWPRRSPAT